MHHLSNVCISPPARWGSLDAIRVASSSFFSSGSLGSQLRAPDVSGDCPTSKNVKVRQNVRKKHIYIYTARWYVENYVRIMCQGWDHLKKVIFHSEMNLMLWLADLFILYLVNSITLKSKSVSNTFGALWQGNDKPFHYFMTCWVMSILIRQPWHSMRIFIKQI